MHMDNMIYIFVLAGKNKTGHGGRIDENVGNHCRRPIAHIHNISVHAHKPLQIIKSRSTVWISQEQVNYITVTKTNKSTGSMDRTN